ncbi:lamin tail domain-containing protein [Haloglomus litoreum]|uniref:lamin tail domain-containing protein n=1 Tax=Haloglomus litoreum TaxID=3034026 RepID=UPI0023E77459|nr:lamin tail domain-containing protein [Haloglomus sp. DT116]
MQRSRLVAVLLATLLLTAGCTASQPAAPPGDGGAADGQSGGASLYGAETTGSVTVTVTRVVDGDTLEVQYDNGTADTVRLLGVDTPEVHTDNSPDEFEGVPETEAGRSCLGRWGERASSYAKETLTGEEVTLYFDEKEGRRGYYGRLLSYVVHDGSNFNYGLVSGGYARVYDSQFTAREAFYDAESTAQGDGTGLWECATESPPTGTATATADGGIHADAEGNDNENLNDEYVTLENTGDTDLSLAGWTVSDEAGKTYTFGDVTLAPGERVTLHTGSGTDGDGDLYWGREGAVWNNGGDTVTVRDDSGAVVAERSY